MGVWSVAILDGGVSNDVEAAQGANLYERDFVDGDFETDPGAYSHGTRVVQSIETVNDRLDRVDLRIMDTNGSIQASVAASSLDHLAELHDAGWQIAAYNASWGSNSSAAGLTDEIDALADRGIYGVAASGNSGASAGLESPIWPARLDNVIAVGSHDGTGTPSWFSQMSGGTVHVLADGENFPVSGSFGTSFAAPQVTATVATVQALANAALDRPLTFDEVIDVLQQGGAGPLSAADPANPAVRYFLHDHDGSLAYFRTHYLDAEFSGWEYLATHGDLMAAFSANADAARDHFVAHGIYEGREVEFDGLRYVASNTDLIPGIGTDRDAAALHWINGGQLEGRSATFDPESYLLANPDLFAAFGNDLDAATRHYITNGFLEGRSTVHAPAAAVSETAGVDLPTSAATAGRIAVNQSVTGTIDFQNDQDWYRIELGAGQTIIVGVHGSPTGQGSLTDPMGAVYGVDGVQLAADDDSGDGRESRFTFTAPDTGTYYVEADGWAYTTGSYTLTVSHTTTPGVTASTSAAEALAGLSGPEPAASAVPDPYGYGFA